MEDLVSIVIPCYNDAGCVRGAVDSALAQTYKWCEVIVVDDGSKDDTQKVLAPYAAAGKIRYIKQENKGLSGARNTGINAARGAYIALLDSDDLFLPDKIEKQIGYFETHSSCDVIYCDSYHFRDDAPEKTFHLRYHYYSGSGHDIIPRLIEGSFIAPSASVFRASVFKKFGGFDEQLRRSEDMEFWLRIARGGVEFYFFPEVLLKLCLRRTKNLQGLESQPAVKLTMLQVLQKFSEGLSPAEREHYNMKHHFMIYRFRLGLAYLLVSDKVNAKKYIVSAFDNYPLGRIVGWFFWTPCAIVPASFIQWTIMRGYYLRRSLRSTSV